MTGPTINIESGNGWKILGNSFHSVAVIAAEPFDTETITPQVKVAATWLLLVSSYLISSLDTSRVKGRTINICSLLHTNQSVGAVSPLLHRLATWCLLLPCWWPEPTVTCGWSRTGPWSKGQASVFTKFLCVTGVNQTTQRWDGDKSLEWGAGQCVVVASAMLMPYQAEAEQGAFPAFSAAAHTMKVWKRNVDSALLSLQELMTVFWFFTVVL